MRKYWLDLGICLFAWAAFGGESVSSFAKTRLDFDLAGCPFGADLKDRPEFVEQPGFQRFQWGEQDEDVSWYTNVVSATYQQAFPHRNLAYAFRNQRLIAVKISIDTFESDPADRKLRQAALDKIRDEVKKLSGNYKLRLGFEDDRTQLEYREICNSAENFVGILVITPVEKTQ